MTTPVFITGFEHGLATLVTSGGGLCTSITGTGMSVQGTTKNTGNYALKCLVSGTAATSYLGWTHTQAIVVGRFYFRFATAPSAITEIFRENITAGNGPRILFDPSDSRVYGMFSTTTGPKSAPLSANTWYCIDFKFDVSTGTSTLDIKVNGTANGQLTYTQAATTMSGARMGFYTAVTGEVYYDDYVLSFTAADYPIGPGGTQLLTPTGDGTHNVPLGTMQNQAGADINGSTILATPLVNSVPMGDTTAYIQQAALDTTAYADVAFSDITATHSSIIGAMGLLAYKSASTTANNGGCIISKDSFSTSTTIWGAPGALSDYSESSNFWKSAIIDGAINDTTINALRARMGYSGDATPDPYWIDIGVEVAYAISSGYTLTCTSTSYSATTQTVGLNVARTLGITSTSFTLAAQNVTLSKGYSLVATSTSFTLSPQTVSILAKRVLSALQTSYTLSSVATGVLKGFSLSISSQTYSATPQNISLLFSRRFVINSTSYSATAQNVILKVARFLLIASTSYTLTPQVITITKSSSNQYVLTANSTSFTLTPQITNLLRSLVLPVQHTSFSVSTQIISYLRTYNLPISATNYVVTPIAISILRTGSYSLSISATTFSLTPQQIGLIKASIFGLQSTSFSLTPQNVALSVGRKLIASPTTYSVNTQVAILRAARVLLAGQTQYSLTGIATTLARGYLLPATTTQFTVTTEPVSLLAHYILLVALTNYGLSPQNVNLILSGGSGVTLFRRKFSSFANRSGSRSIFK